VSSNLEKSSISIFKLIRSWESRWFMKTDAQTDVREESYFFFFALSLQKHVEKTKERKTVNK